MTRRDLLSKFTAALAAMGVAGEASAVEEEPKPLFFKLVCKKPISTEMAHQIKRSWDASFEGKPPGKLLVFQSGMDIVPVHAAPAQLANFDSVTGKPVRQTCYQCGGRLDVPTIGPTGVPWICPVCCRHEFVEISAKARDVAAKLKAGLMTINDVRKELGIN